MQDQHSNQKSSTTTNSKESSVAQVSQVSQVTQSVSPAKVKLKPLRTLIDSVMPRWKNTQWSPRGAWNDVHELKQAVRELQENQQLLIDRINNCKDCNKADK